MTTKEFVIIDDDGDTMTFLLEYAGRSSRMLSVRPEENVGVYVTASDLRRLSNTMTRWAIALEAEESNG